MNIRNRLTLRYIMIVAIILPLGFLLIYVFSADYREETFYNRLYNKATNTAKLLIDVDEVDAALLQKMEKDNPVSFPHERIVIYDFRNQVLFSTDEENEIHIDQPLLDRIRVEQEIRYKEKNFEVLGFLFKGQYDRFTVIAAATDTYGLNKLQNLATILLIVFSVCTIIFAISGWVFARKALEPISKVVDKVDEITVSSLNLRVDEGNGQDEIAKLAKTFNNMLARIENSFKAQKNFIANASHELRTPLTVITAQLEVALINARTNEEYRQIIDSVLEDIKGLTLLSNRLLLLAQTSADGNERILVNLRLDDLLWESREELLRSNPSYSIQINLDHRLDDDGKLTVKGDEQLIKSVLVNIIENGCKYSPNHAIQVSVGSSQRGLVLAFRDKGIGIPETDLPSVFEPFYRGANVKNVSGHGIGLSIVKPILKLHGATLDLATRQGSGTTFTITFPTA